MEISRTWVSRSNTSASLRPGSRLESKTIRAAVVVAEPQVTLGAEHAAALDPANLDLADFLAVLAQLGPPLGPRG